MCFPPVASSRFWSYLALQSAGTIIPSKRVQKLLESCSFLFTEEFIPKAVSEPIYESNDSRTIEISISIICVLGTIIGYYECYMGMIMVSRDRRRKRSTEVTTSMLH